MQYRDDLQKISSTKPNLGQHRCLAFGVLIKLESLRYKSS